MFYISISLDSLGFSFIGKHVFKEKHKYYDVYFYDIKDDESLDDKEPYLNFWLYTDGYLYISMIDANHTKIKGTDIINMVVDYAKNTYVDIIQLEDQSSITVDIYGQDIKMNLAGMTILSSGNSWYNRLGFEQDNFQTESKQWSDIRKMSLEDIKGSFLKLKEGDIDNKGYFGSPFDLLDIDSDDFDYKILIMLEYLYSREDYINTNIGMTSAMIYNNLRYFSYDDQELLLYHFVYISAISMLLKYDRFLYMKLKY